MYIHQTLRQINRHSEKQKDRFADIFQTKSQLDSQIDMQKDKKVDKQKNRQVLTGQTRSDKIISRNAEKTDILNVDNPRMKAQRSAKLFYYY